MNKPHTGGTGQRFFKTSEVTDNLKHRCHLKEQRSQTCCSRKNAFFRGQLFPKLFPT
jgi:hypothetical protein